MAVTLNALTTGVGGLQTTGDTSGVIALQSNGTTSVTINSFGIGLGSAVPSSGIGITFPATQSASSDANTLDDYEEGTWTPVDGSGASLSFTSVSGTYIKIGRTVTCLFDLTYPSTANSSQAVIGGLPFSGTRGSMITSYSFTLTFVPLGDIGGTLCNLYGKGSNPGSAVLNSDMSTKRILGTMIYITAS
jgi:hypothetical protein